MNVVPLNIVIAFHGDVLIQGVVSATEQYPQHFNISAICKTGIQLIEASLKYEPNVIVMSPKLENCDSLSAIIRVKEKLPDTEFLIFARSSEYHLIYNYISAGVKGFIPQATPLDIISKAITLISMGAFLVLPPINDVFTKNLLLMHEYSPLFEKSKVENLSHREKDILKLIADGLDNEEIAKKLYISTNTVKVHLRNIMDKTNIHHRYELMILYNSVKM